VKKKMTLCLIVLLCGGMLAGSAAAQEPTVEPVVTDHSAEEPAIKACVLDYLEGWFTSDAARMERALHPSLFKCRLQPLPGTDAEILDIVDASALITYTAHNQAWVEGKEGVKEMKILYNDGRIAVVHAVSDGFYDVCGLIKVDGRWKLLQVLWDVN
jgi:hypothetical protein